MVCLGDKMAVVNVYRPQDKKVDNTGRQLAQVGGLISMIPHPYAKAAGGAMVAGGTLMELSKPEQTAQQYEQAPIQSQQASIQMPSQTPRAAQAELDMPDYSSALNRRTQLAQNADKELLDARAALEALDMDQELKMKLQKPLEAAIAAQRSLG